MGFSLLSPLLFLLAFAPLAFGTVEPWSYAILESGVFMTGLLWFMSKGLGEGAEGRTSIKWISVPGGWPVLIFLGYVLLQAMPLPAAVVRVLSPGTYETVMKSAALLPPGPGNDSGLPGWMTLSIYPHATFIEWLKCVCYALTYFLAVQIIDREERLTTVNRAWVLLGLAIAFFGIIQGVAGNGKIYWFRTLTGGGRLFGPYVNRNHFAGFLELVLPLAVSITVFSLPGRGGRGIRDYLIRFLTHPRGNESMLSGFSSVVMAGALFYCMSRGGILSFLGSMIFMGLLLSRQLGMKRAGKRIIVFGVMVFLFVSWLEWSPILERFERLRDLETERYRYQVWMDSFGIVKDFPLLGTGLGTFEYAYPAYKSIDSEILWDYAHNDYIQLAAETGMTGLLLLAWFFYSFFRHVLSLLARRRNLYYRLVATGGLAGIISLLLHSLVDFNLHIGANAFLFALLMGLTAASVSLKSRPATGSLLVAGSMNVPLSRAFPLGAGALMTLFLLSASVGAAAADLYYRGGLRYITNRNPATEENRRRAFELASKLAPGDFRFPYALAAEAEAAGRESFKEEWAYTRKAWRLFPVSPDVAVRISGLYLRSGDTGRAVTAYKRAIDLAPRNPDLRMGLALWYMKDPGARDKAMAEFRRAVEFRPAWTGHVLKKVRSLGVSFAELRKILPESGQARLEYARYLAAKGMKSEAMPELSSLIRQSKAGEGKQVVKTAYDILAGIQEEYGELDKSLLTRAESVRAFPDDARLRIQLALLYEKMGITVRALEEYRRVVQIAPENRAVRIKIRTLSEDMP